MNLEMTNRINLVFISHEKILQNVKQDYLEFSDEDALYAVTVWIVADFDKPAGRRLLSDALKSLVSF